MANEIRTKYGHTAKDIAQDFAEQLKYSLDADTYHVDDQAKYQAAVLAIRDRIIHQWDLSRKTQRAKSAKRVYYLSLEFLMGRAMTNNIINLGIEKQVKDAFASLGYQFEELADIEPDAGLGNGGLGRLAACFLDSLATLELPAYGYGIRYNYGIFKQQIRNGWQAELPDNWLENGNPWEVKRPSIVYPVYFGGEVKVIRENGKDIYKWVPAEQVNGMAYDTPIIGYGGKTINTLRLWSAMSPAEFSFQEFNSGDYTEAVRNKINAENIFIFPNNKNIVMAANQAKFLVEDKNIVVIPTKTIPQGITAIINYVPDMTVEENESVMLSEIANVKSGEVTYAVRDTMIDDKEIKEGDYMGIGDKGILSVGTDMNNVVYEMVDAMANEDTELISIYYGEDVDEQSADELCRTLADRYGDCDVELQFGGQPIYYYIVSCE